MIISGSFSPQKTFRTISFSGYTWKVKKHDEKTGPGPNYFSDKDSAVWVDSKGRLHLRMLEHAGKWFCAEVICLDTLGYGTYIFEVETPPDSLDISAVLGLFTWSPEQDKHHHEIDIELSRWSDEKDKRNIQYVVQPFTKKNNILRFQIKATETHRHSFNWKPERVEFGSRVMNDTLHHIIRKKVPYTYKTQARINLWLYHGAAPKRKGRNEVVLNGFKFKPA